jgi:Putative MetA-pathway of phenol degradation
LTSFPRLGLWLVAVNLPALAAAQLADSAKPIGISAPAISQVVEISARQSAEDAWFTGPMLANSAATLPHGHALIETYAFAQIEQNSRLYGSLTYLLYGVTDKFTVGVKPFFGMVDTGQRSPLAGMGDVTLSAQYRLTSTAARVGTPTISLSLQESLPTGRYDRLTGHRGAALGSGAHTTTLSLYGQQYFWLPNRRIFRARVNLSGTWSTKADITGASVYGTLDDFAGQVRPGAVFAVGLSGEYSFTREWVLALDLVFSHKLGSHLSGLRSSLAQGDPAHQLNSVSPIVNSVAIAPAIEYSWRPNLGVLFAARFIPAWGRAPASVTPAIAVNYVY